MRKYARVKEVKQDYEQPEFERSILIVDDHAVVRSGVRRIVEDHPDWSVVAEAADGIAKAIATEPDVVILDYALPLIDGIEATRQIRQRMPSIEVLIFTMHDNDNLLRDMVKAGARS
ncbi:MAG: DNA-binding response regulator [Hyphomicrobiaceae bacterium]|nr:MAG: DNA-binding response regulator [Hyphomicrobiaceae bacterium]